MKKLVFPVETLPVNLVISGLVTELFALVIFLVFLLGARGGIPATALWIPVILIPQVLLTAGLCWLLSATGVYIRDLGQVMGFLLTLWFFLTPICYPETSLPAGAAAILTKNPVYILVRAYRSVLLESRAPDWPALAVADGDFAARLLRRARLVLQAAEVVCGRDLGSPLRACATARIRYRPWS